MNHMPTPVPESVLAGRQQSASALTPRQAEVLRLVASGRPYKHVAAQLGISYWTVKNHIVGICARLDVDTVIEAFVVSGWLVPMPYGETWTEAA